jgi:hypothetical protein
MDTSPALLFKSTRFRPHPEIGCPGWGISPFLSPSKQISGVSQIIPQKLPATRDKQLKFKIHAITWHCTIQEIDSIVK